MVKRAKKKRKRDISIAKEENTKQHYTENIRLRNISLKWTFFPHENDIAFVFTSSCLLEGWCLVCIICVCLRIVMSNTYCVVFFVFVFCLRLVYPVLPVSWDCPFLISLSGISNLYLYMYTSVDTEMCCPKGKCGCQYFILLT